MVFTEGNYSPGQEGPDSAAARESRNFWARAAQKFRFIAAELMESGKVSVVSLATGEAIDTVTRDEHSDGCSGGRRFSAPSGELILGTTDWIGY